MVAKNKDTVDKVISVLLMFCAGKQTVSKYGVCAKGRRGGLKPFWFVENDGGFTSVGVVIALTLTLALLFTSAQVYWVNSTSGEIQFAADAGALAAENVVAEYYVIARIADAVVLSLSLFGILVYGIAIVVSCIPYAQSVGSKLMEFGNKVFEARTKISKQANNMLAKLQKALPFLAAVNAASVISSNKFSPHGEANYQGLAILVPLEGEAEKFADNEEAEKETNKIEETNEKTAEQTDAAEEARKEMDKAKLDGYLADCGSAPNYCMYERASHLAGLSGAKNPHFSSVDLWKFEYALDRAKAYYPQRAAIEVPTGSLLEERIDSRVRSQFYQYAIEEMAKGYARTDASGALDAYFPLLARNYDEIRKTRLYTDKMFPVDSDGKMHGVSDCSEFSGSITAWGSIADLESGIYVSCTSCDLGMKTIGKVASATTSTKTGFEHHYRKVAEAAEAYKQAYTKYSESIEAAKGSANEAFDSFEDALDALKTTRLDPKPPGRNGCIVFAFDAMSHAIPTALGSGFVSGDATLSPRVALSAAALVEDTATEGNSILSSFLDRAKEQSIDGSLADAGFGVFDGILGMWGDLLLGYTKGVDSVTTGVGDLLRSIPIVNSTPLASWAEDALQEAIKSLGLEGVNLSAPKPVIVNSIHVVNASDSKAIEAIGKAKSAYTSIPGSGSGTLADGLIDGILVEVEAQGSEFLDREFTVFTISFGDIFGAPQIPIRIKLPEAVSSKGKDKLKEGLESVGSLLGGGGNGDFWQ